MSKYHPIKDCIIRTIDYKLLLRGIPKGTADLILTDPPYSISRKTGFKSTGKKSVERFAVSMDFGKWDQKEINLKTLADESYKALREGGTIICFYDLWKITKVQEAFKNAGFKMIRIIIWEKTNPVPLNSKRFYLTNTREVAILGVKKGKPVFKSEYDNGIYEMPIHRDKRIHPTQKPLVLMEELIDKHSNKGDLIIDPFFGSGTTGLASITLNRKFVGGDINSEYIKLARKRIQNAVTKKRPLFKTSKSRHERSFS